MTIFGDDKYDYFRTSDGRLWKAPQNLAQEAAEARFLRRMYWVRLWNRALLYGRVAFLCGELVFIGLLIGGA